MSTDITLADLQARTIEEGDCLLWTGHASLGKYPQWRVNGKLQPARRIVYEAVHGPLPSRMQVGVRCLNTLCVHPDCLVARTKARAMKGTSRGRVARAHVAEARRKQSPLNLDMDKVRAIRASVEPGPVVEARYGLAVGYASKIRRNAVWKDFANPFAGLERQA